MIEQFRLTLNQPDALPLPSTVKAILIHTALDRGRPGPDYEYGYGRVDGGKAIGSIVNQWLYEDRFSSTGEIREYRYVIPQGTPELRVSIAWDDYPAVPESLIQLVNDLDLTVTSPTGQVYEPMVLNPASPASAAVHGVDHLNNQEQVLISNPSAGGWTVRVRAYNLPHSPQNFSIVFPGINTSLLIQETSPAALPLSLVDQTLTIRGLGFSTRSEIYWNGSKLSTSVFTNPNEIQVTIPTALLRDEGTALVHVQNPGTMTIQSPAFEVPIAAFMHVHIPLVPKQ
jgi:hypothetical protein